MMAPGVPSQKSMYVWAVTLTRKRNNERVRYVLKENDVVGNKSANVNKMSKYITIEKSISRSIIDYETVSAS